MKLLARFLLLGALLISGRTSLAAPVSNELFSESALSPYLELPEDTSGGRLRGRKTEILLRNSEGRLYLPESVTLNLFDDMILDAWLVERYRNSKGIDVWRGYTYLPELEHMPGFANVMLYLNYATNRISGLINYHGRLFVLEPSADEGQYFLSEYQHLPYQDHSVQAGGEFFESYHSKPLEYLLPYSDQNSVVIDVFIGFSESARRLFVDLDLVATQMVEEVNNALVNSQVENVRLDLTGTGVAANNPGVLPEVVSQVEHWFTKKIHELQPDVVAFVQPRKERDTALGHGSLGAYVSDNGFSTTAVFPPTAVFRHEMGHNLGGGHCAGDRNLKDFPYAHGYSNSNSGWKTIMCGNNINMYSNPDVLDHLGYPMGDPETANMARVWRERAKAISLHRRSSALTTVMVDTSSGEFRKDGRCSLGEALENANHRERYWADCAFGQNIKIVFDGSLFGERLFLDRMPSVSGKVLIDCGYGRVSLSTSKEAPVLTVLKGGEVSFKNCSVRGHHSKKADALVNQGELVLERTTVADANTGILNQGVLLLKESTVENNTYGIVTVGESVVLEQSVVRDNLVAGFYGQNKKKTTIHIVESTIEKNGGGIVMDTVSEAFMMIHKSTISDNGVEGGVFGGIYLRGTPHCIIQESTISGNKALEGGAIYAGSTPQLLLVYTTVTNNLSDSGSGAVHIPATAKDIRFNQSILSDQQHQGSNCFIEPPATVKFLMNSVVSDDSCTMGDGTNILGVSARLNELLYNGGYTRTHSLQQHSPAVNGTLDCCCTAVDQRGQKRPEVGCDIGAYQTSPYEYVKTTEVIPVAVGTSIEPDIGSDLIHRTSYPSPSNTLMKMNLSFLGIWLLLFYSLQ